MSGGPCHVSGTWDSLPSSLTDTLCACGGGAGALGGALALETGFNASWFFPMAGGGQPIEGSMGSSRGWGYLSHCV